MKGLFETDFFLIVFGLFFTGFALKSLSKSFLEIHIDKTKNKIYEKKNPIFEKLNPAPVISENINDIHAIQVIGEHVSSNSGSSGTSNYKSFEMNMVTKDLRRFCIMDHGDISSLLEDAKQLANFLNVPVWDAT